MDRGWGQAAYPVTTSADWGMTMPRNSEAPGRVNHPETHRTMGTIQPHEWPRLTGLRSSWPTGRRRPTEI